MSKIDTVSDDEQSTNMNDTEDEEAIELDDDELDENDESLLEPQVSLVILTKKRNS